MLDFAGMHIGYCFNATMWMPGKTGEIIIGIVRSKVIQKEEWIKMIKSTMSHDPFQMDPGTFDYRNRINKMLYLAIAHDFAFFW